MELAQAVINGLSSSTDESVGDNNSTNRKRSTRSRTNRTAIESRVNDTSTLTDLTPIYQQPSGTVETIVDMPNTAESSCVTDAELRQTLDDLLCVPLSQDSTTLGVQYSPRDFIVVSTPLFQRHVINPMGSILTNSNLNAQQIIEFTFEQANICAQFYHLLHQANRVHDRFFP